MAGESQARSSLTAEDVAAIVNKVLDERDEELEGIEGADLKKAKMFASEIGKSVGKAVSDALEAQAAKQAKKKSSWL